MKYVKSLARQLATRGIRVNGVAPGPIWTPLQVSGGAATMEKLEKFGGGARRFGRPGQPAERRPSMCSSPTPTPAYVPPARFTARGRRRRATVRRGA